jgi:ribosomal protection tetracycline resistance protein
VRERVRFGEVEDRVTAIRVHHGGGLVRSTSVTAGQMAQVTGLESARVGDAIGDVIGTNQDRNGDRKGAETGTLAGVHQFAPPTLETAVEPVEAKERGRLHAALTRLAESDPLINLRQDDVRGETHLSLYGEVQKEVIAATLDTDFGVKVRFRETTVICVERLIGEGAAFEIIDVAPNPYLATVGLRVAPGAPGSGVEFRLDVELGSMPLAFFRAVEDTVHETLTQGLHGWPVLDCVVSMTHSGYYPRQSHAHQGFSKAMSSTASDFRGLTPLVLMEAMREAGTQVDEPMHRFDFDLPAGVLGPALTLLSHVRATPSTTEVRGTVAHLGGLVPAAHVHELQQRVPGLTGGEGDLVCEFEGYRAVGGAAPVRPRTGPDPLNRRTWLLEVPR